VLPRSHASNPIEMIHARLPPDIPASVCPPDNTTIRNAGFTAVKEEAIAPKSPLSHA